MMGILVSRSVGRRSEEERGVGAQSGGDVVPVKE